MKNRTARRLKNALGIACLLAASLLGFAGCFEAAAVWSAAGSAWLYLV